MWCNRKNEVLQILMPDSHQLNEMLSVAKRSLGIREVVRTGQCALTMTRDCTCNKYKSVASIADKNACWLLPPTIYFGGWETHRILSPGKTNLQRFVAELKRNGCVDIISHKTRDDLGVLFSIGAVQVHFFEGLTERQLHSIVLAYENGLLEVPARVQMDKVARIDGISRSTYGEHLRKALYQIIRNSYPILKLYDTVPDRMDE